MSASSLPIDLRRLANHVRACAKLGLGMSVEECGRVAVLLQRAAQESDRVVAQAADLPELEDELIAVATDRAGPDPSPYQAALKAQQMQLQRALEATRPEPVSRPGLVALAVPVGDTNILVMPIAPRSRPGGDVA